MATPTIDELLRELARMGHGARIVSSNDLTIDQINQARVSGRFYVTDEGYGYALLGPNVRTMYDARNYT